jgi:hypothetical protein
MFLPMLHSPFTASTLMTSGGSGAVAKVPSSAGDRAWEAHVGPAEKEQEEGKVGKGYIDM